MPTYTAAREISAAGRSAAPVKALARGNSNQPGAALEGDVAPQPVHGDHEAVAQSDQEIDVDRAPEHPADESGELNRAELHHRGLAADRGEIAEMVIGERRRRRTPFD